MFIWSPLIAKIGKRPIYVISFVFFFLCAVWAALAETIDTVLVARMGIGFFSGGAECLAPLTITDLFFVSINSHATPSFAGADLSLGAFPAQVHERGTYLGFYQGMILYSCDV